MTLLRALSGSIHENMWVANVTILHDKNIRYDFKFDRWWFWFLQIIFFQVCLPIREMANPLFSFGQITHLDFYLNLFWAVHICICICISVNITYLTISILYNVWQYLSLLDKVQGECLMLVGQIMFYLCCCQEHPRVDKALISVSE